MRSQDEWNDVTAHWSNQFAWEEINFHQNRTEPRHDSMLNVGAEAQLNLNHRKKLCAHDLGLFFLSRGTVA